MLSGKAFMSSETKTITLRDGRTLAYTEHGDLSGQPVIFMHGNPGSRLMRHPDESIAESLGVRMITPDRPGYGMSDFLPKRTLLDFPGDIEQLADSLGIGEFAVFGVSAGGPCAAVTAYKLSERVKAAAIVSGASPVDRDGAFEGMNDAFRAAFQISAKYPGWLLRYFTGRQMAATLANPEKALEVGNTRRSAADLALLENPAIREQVIGYWQESARQGVKGIVREAQILASPWGFRLEDIQPQAHLWYWQDDTAVPMQMGEYLAAHIPNTVTHFLPGGGHLSFLTHWREILEALVAG
ncbi:MAG: alpha/beta hydrolase [Anaerolineaceae bacterium]|nr:alpha/beta hydrolase [Anaerolineaceae bacterium]